LRRQNVGAYAEASPYCYGTAESAAADFSQTSLMFSQKVLIPPHAVTNCAVAAGRPAFMGGLSPALYQLIVPARHAENVTNIGVDKNTGACHDFTYFRQNYSSQYLCSHASYKKLVKTKSDHHHCPISVYILLTCK
jgi:hypothetical protein